jgi:hypothetical protein
MLLQIINVQQLSLLCSTTFNQFSYSLSVGKDCLHVDAHGPLRAVLAADDGEAEALQSGTLFKLDGLDAEVLLCPPVQAAAAARKSAELGGLLK